MAERAPRPGSTYQHFKGATYEVLGVGMHTETNEEFVVYHRCDDPDRLFLRPVEMFLDRVDRDGYAGPRFKRVYCDTCQMEDPIWMSKCVLCAIGALVVAVLGRLLMAVAAILLIAAVAAVLS